MTTPSLDFVQHSMEKASLWITELDDALGTNDPRAALRTLRAVLHTIRDRLGVEEAADLASQLPTLVRGLYENWRPATVPQSYRDVHPFLRRIADEALLAGETEASYAAQAVMDLLRRHVSRGEIEDVLSVLPAPVRRVLDAKR